MLKPQEGPGPDSSAEERKRSLVKKGVAILSGLVLVCLLAYFYLNRTRKSSDTPVRPPLAELVSASGMVLMQNPGNPEWREVKAGAHFCEADLVRTDSSGEAEIRYKNGPTVTISQNTVLKIDASGGNEMEITASPDAAMPPVLLAGANGLPDSKPGEGPFIELQQIIPFGKSLELIGRVEAGSSLYVNDEIVEVTGEGKFKHFTRPFASSAQVARLNLKVTDLAGRTRVYTATHDFRSPGGRE